MKLITSEDSMLTKAWSPARWGVAVLLLLSAGCATSSSAPAAKSTAEQGESSALDYYARGCNAGEAGACANAGRVLMHPASPYHDDVRAVEFRTKACDANAYYCGDLGNMYYSGKGVQKDEGRGLGYLDRGCAAKNADACSTARLVHDRSQSADADKAVAKKQENKKPDTKSTSDAKVNPEKRDSDDAKMKPGKKSPSDAKHKQKKR